MKKITGIFFLIVLIIYGSPAFAQREMENLDRGIVAVRKSADTVYIGWRMLGTEPDEISFNIYRQTGNENPVRLNKTPIKESTNYVDGQVNFKSDLSWFVKAVLKGKEVDQSRSFTLKADAPVQQYINIPLRTPAGYTPNDVSAGDLDGDGEYEIVMHQTGRSIDTPSTGISGIPVFQAYKLNGKFLWEISLGRNIREGAHYTQFMVYDLDGDGSAEFACKTADGTIDGKGVVIGDSTKDWRNLDKASGPFYGKVLAGPEYFTIFSGRTGAALATTDYIPNRLPLNGWNGHGGNGGGDSTGNRVDRFLACVAYLDGVHPSVIMCRGYYGRSVLAAWDWRNGKLTSRWVFDSKDGENPYSGQGNHNLSVADVDGDGKDEIIYGSMVVDDDGKGLFSTGFRHGDAIHVGHLDPDRPGLQVFGIHEIESKTTGPGVSVYDARTGEVLFKGSINKDVGRGVAADIDPSNPGAEMWWAGSGGLFSMKGTRIGDSPSSCNFLIWWDGDLTRELLDGNHIDKYKVGRLFTADGCVSNNGTKSTPALSADLFGDWREEVIFRTSDNQNLRIYTTTIPTQNRIYTLMHDPQYRLAIATQNVAYNQPPNTSFFLGTGMKTVPKPYVTTPVKPVMVTDNPQYNDQLVYFTSTSLLKDDKRLIFLSDKSGNTNVFLRNLVTGREKQLTFNTEGSLKSYVYFDGTPYKGLGRASVSVDETRGLVYFIQGRKICSVDTTGKLRILAEYPNGQMTAFTHVSADGTRLCVPTTDARALDGDTQLKGKPAYDIDARVRSENLSSYIRVYDTRTGKEILCEKVPGAWITHVQFSPRDNNLILYNNEWPSDCGIRRMWLWDGKKHIRLRNEGDGRKAADWTCHEMWERDGSAIIYHGNYVNGVNYIGRVLPDGTGTVEVPLPAEWKRYGHFTVGDPGWLVTDGCYQQPDDPKGSGAWISIVKMDWNAKKYEWKAICRNGSSWKTQDEHPHPIFNHRADAVYFTSDKTGKRAVYKIDVPR